MYNDIYIYVYVSAMSSIFLFTEKLLREKLRWTGVKVVLSRENNKVFFLYIIFLYANPNFLNV